MQKFHHFCLALLSVSGVACQNTNQELAYFQPGRSDRGVIYGADNRLDLFEVQNSMHIQLADSTVALIEATALAEQPNGVTDIMGETFGELYSLCEDEPYRDQDAPAFCSGSLIAADIIMTAGHCVRSQTSCEGTRFVFGYGVRSKGEMPKQVPSNEIYHCAELIHSQVLTNGSDFALVRLDRPVVGHAPLQINKSSQIKTGDPLLVIGHPAGLPTKVADGATVRSASDPSYIVANLDTYGGNSGSAVFNALSGEIEGILVRGETDFVRRGTCNVSYQCESDACRGEDVTRISEVLQHLPQQSKEAPTHMPPTVTIPGQGNLQIPDNDPEGTLSGLEVQDSLSGYAVQVSVDISHPWVGDLEITLIAPSGAHYILSSRDGSSMRNLIGVYGDTLPSNESLSPLSTIDKKGKWQLKISDLAGFDVGHLNQWSLVFVPQR